MITKNIKLNKVSDVKDFVAKASVCDYDIELVDNKYTVDAKSILGIFSLDFSEPVKMKIETDGDVEPFLNSISQYIC